MDLGEIWYEMNTTSVDYLTYVLSLTTDNTSMEAVRTSDVGKTLATSKAVC